MSLGGMELFLAPILISMLGQKGKISPMARGDIAYWPLLPFLVFIFLLISFLYDCRLLLTAVFVGFLCTSIRTFSYAGRSFVLTRRLLSKPGTIIFISRKFSFSNAVRF